VIGAECIVGALCFVPAEMQVPDRKVVVGNPARIVKDVSDAMLAWKTDGTALYQALPAELRSGLHEVEPLREVEPDRPAQPATYRTWRQVAADSADEV
jgi:carbonic anhydrase/acetyltransferase-like protein (isoleucine patch superfamily)